MLCRSIIALSRRPFIIASSSSSSAVWWIRGDDDHPVYREWEDDKKLIGRFISVYYWISVIDNVDNKRSLVNDDGGNQRRLVWTVWPNQSERTTTHGMMMMRKSYVEKILSHCPAETCPLSINTISICFKIVSHVQSGAHKTHIYLTEPACNRFRLWWLVPKLNDFYCDTKEIERWIRDRQWRGIKWLY